LVLDAIKVVRVRSTRIARRPPRFNPKKVTKSWVKSLMALYTNGSSFLTEAEYTAMAKAAVTIQTAEGALAKLTLPESSAITIIGDTHGQYDDVVTILEAVGLPSTKNVVLFNGDIVDRGPKQIQLLSLVLALKLAFPGSVHVVRGNHETRTMNQFTERGFAEVVQQRFTETLWNNFCDYFDELPVMALVSNSLVCVHGGLPQHVASGFHLSTLEHMGKVRSPDLAESEAADMYNELMWNDSSPENGFSPNQRGPDVKSFGPDVTLKFLKENDLSLVVRSHDVRHEGFEVEHDSRLVTVFSAPAYCGMANKAAFLRFAAQDMADGTAVKDDNIFQFEARPLMTAKKVSVLRRRVRAFDKKHGVQRSS